MCVAQTPGQALKPVLGTLRSMWRGALSQALLPRAPVADVWYCYEGKSPVCIMCDEL